MHITVFSCGTDGEVDGFAVDGNIESTQADSKINIYPNPAKETINIENLYENKPYSISIYDGVGKMVKTLTTSSTTVDVSTFPNGVYYLTILSENDRFVERFVVKR